MGGEARCEIKIRPRRVASVLGTLVAIFALLSLLTIVFRFGLGRGRVFGFVEQFDLDSEYNIPTYFASLLLLTAAVLLAVIASWKRKAEDAFTYHWAVLAVLFLYISADEVIRLHERLNEPMRDLFGAGGWFYFGWVIPGLIAVTLLALFYVRFLLHLDRRFLMLFLASGAIYVAGALGMEMVAARYVEAYGLNNAPYALMATVEETMELAGVSLFIYALLKYVEVHIREVRFWVGSEAARPKAVASLYADAGVERKAR